MNQSSAAGSEPFRLHRSTLGLVGVLLLVACAAPERVTPDQAGADRLYGELDQSVSRYREGLVALREGDRDGGRQIMSDAVAELAAGGDQCVNTPGCEPQRYMAAYNNLLALRSSVLTGAAEGFVEMEAEPDAEAIMLSQLPQVSRSVNLLNGQKLADIIQVNGPVKAAMHDWLTWMRPNLIDAYENYQFMRHLMFPAYEEAGLPEALLFGILAKESGGRVHATSHAGAAGPLQFMYHTGLRFGLGKEDGFDMRYDPAASARANVAYLNEQFRTLNNNLELALGAYNGGEGRMRRLAQGTRNKNFWSPEIFSRLPRETQDYVPYVLAAAWLFLHPEDYGLEFPRLDNAPGSVQLAKASTLSELTMCIGQSGSRAGWFRTLRNLNPRLDPNKTIKAGTEVAMPQALVDVYQRQCVDGRLAQVAAEIQRARVPGGTVAHGGGKQYVVKAGDTLASIARRQGCSSAQALARANNIAPPRYLIRPSQQLMLSGCTG